MIKLKSSDIASHSSLQSLEKFSGQTTLVAHHLEAFMRQIHDTEFPNSVEATEQLLIEQSGDYTRLKVRKFIAWVEIFFLLIMRFVGRDFVRRPSRRGAAGGDSQEDGNVCGPDRQHQLHRTVSR